MTPNGAKQTNRLIGDVDLRHLRDERIMVEAYRRYWKSVEKVISTLDMWNHHEPVPL